MTKMEALERLIGYAHNSSDETLKECAEVLHSASGVQGYFEQKHDNDQVRQGRASGYCPTCGEEWK